MKKLIAVCFVIILFLGIVGMAVESAKADVIPSSEYFLSFIVGGSWTWARTNWNLYWEFFHVDNVTDLPLVESLMSDGYTYMDRYDYGQRNGITDYHPHPHPDPYYTDTCALEFEFNGGIDHILNELSFISSRMRGVLEIRVDYALDGGEWITAVSTNPDELGPIVGTETTFTIELGGVKADHFRFVTLAENMIIHEIMIDGSIAVSLDIKPGTDPNSINLESKGKVPVAILTTDEFDACDVDPDTVVFAGAAPVRCTMEDVDLDGDEDMICHFNTQELDSTEDSTEGTLTGSTFDGMDIEGTEAVNIVPYR